MMICCLLCLFSYLPSKTVSLNHDISRGALLAAEGHDRASDSPNAGVGVPKWFGSVWISQMAG